jgi:hypothetical protein
VGVDKGALLESERLGSKASNTERKSINIGRSRKLSGYISKAVINQNLQEFFSLDGHLFPLRDGRLLGIVLRPIWWEFAVSEILSPERFECDEFRLLPCEASMKLSTVREGHIDKNVTIRGRHAHLLIPELAVELFKGVRPRLSWKWVVHIFLASIVLFFPVRIVSFNLRRCVRLQWLIGIVEQIGRGCLWQITCRHSRGPPGSPAQKVDNAGAHRG